MPKELTDGEVAQRVLAGESALFEILVRRYNTRLYRIVRAILGNRAEVDDAIQQTYLNAFAHLDQFAERSTFSTWLTRIAVHEALRRSRRRNSRLEMALASSDDDSARHVQSSAANPEQAVLNRELERTLEAAIDSLPEEYRAVFVLRDIENMSTSETAECLAISQPMVKTRLSRARAMLRRHLYARAGVSLENLFTFHDERCNSVVSFVLTAIGELPHHVLTVNRH